MKLKRITGLLLAIVLLLPCSRAVAFNIVWMTDTQNYVSASSPVLERMMRWVADRKESCDIRYVFHTGDIVSASKSDRQWEFAGNAMSILAEEGIPFMAVTGNHDTGKKASYSRYMDYVGSLQPLSLEREYGETGTRYELFSGDGRDYIFMGVAYSDRGPSEEEAAWVREQLNKYPDRIAVILTHSYIKKSAAYTTQGRAILKGIVSQCPNVRLVLSGHCRDISSREDMFDDDMDGIPDRTVYSVMSNFQDCPSSRGGYMRIMKFNPDEIFIYTYSPVEDSFEYPGSRGKCIAIVPLPEREK